MRFFPFLLALAMHSAAWTPWFSWGGGFTHYQAQELNQAMSLFAKRASDSAAGFNSFSMEQFNGHPYQFFGLGIEQGPWRFSLEGDYWVEDFRQSGVPFYTGRGSDPLAAGKILSCADLQDPNFKAIPNSLLGCIDARESFVFIPLSAGIAYQWKWGNRFFSRIGYQAGIMAGHAGLQIKTHYFAGSGVDDQLDMDLDPGINLLQKINWENEYRPLPYVGLSLRAGWRFSQLGKVELKNIQGHSQILSLAFNRDFQNGDQFYIESFRGSSSEQNALSISQSKDFVKDPKYYNLIQGDFNGWNLALALNFYWRAP